MTKKWTENLRKIEPYVPGEQPKNKNIIKLNANENPYPPSPKVLEALKNFDVDTLKFYPDANSSKLKKAVANYFQVSEKQVFVGNGSDDVIALGFLSFFQSQKPVLFPDITYSFYPVWCSLFNTPYKTIPLGEDFTINQKDYHIENGGIILPNPNAPTGIGQSTEFFEEILINNQDSIVIIDEAYVDFGASSCVPLLDKYENLLIVHTFSKSRSLAGMRIGVAIGSELLIQTLEAVKNSYNSYTLDAFAIELGHVSISDTVYLKEITDKIIKTRETTSCSLKELGFTVYPSMSNFLFVSHTNIDAKELFLYLKENNIFIRHFDKPKIQNHLRITIGLDSEMQVLLKHIKEFCNTI